ncbi:transcriptional regulator GcvA [Limnohabitans sp.]|uniref:transcriptional regulator GcvA n=1 Tax=Limnohabitans sp. TaxID=1907725 RepID=UPI0038BCEF32
MRKLPPLNAVRAFEAAARHVSFTKAAKELFVTHGAVSKQVAVLEAWLSTPLFNRSQSQLSLTDAGRTFLTAVTPALDRIAVTAMQLVEQAEPTALRINAPPTFTMRWLIPRISAFQKRRGGVEVKLTTSTAPVNFEERGYDVAIRGAHEPLPGMVSVPFMTETIVPICHPDLLEGGRLKDPVDLAQHTLISYDTEPLNWAEWLALAQVPQTQQPSKSLQFEQMYFALQAAAEGLGLVLVPLFLVADDVIAGRLCAPFGLRVARQRRYFANSPLGAAQNPVIESFSDWLVKEGQDTERSIAQLADTMKW